MAKKNAAPAYVFFAPNEEGRDFTISIVDRSIFSKLESEGFDPSTDRLIYVGEILSASARPSATLCSLLKKDYFYAVRDEATASFLTICTDGGMYDYEGATDRGFHWVVNEAYSGSFELGELATRLRQLPTIIDMQTPQGLVGFAPAAIPPEMTWGDFTKKITARDRSALNAVYYGHEADSIKGIDKLCIASRYPTKITGNVVSVGETLTEISSLFKVVSINQGRPPVESAPPLPLAISYRPAVHAAAAGA